MDACPTPNGCAGPALDRLWVAVGALPDPDVPMGGALVLRGDRSVMGYTQLDRLYRRAG
jgi:hypothetical protein